MTPTVTASISGGAARGTAEIGAPTGVRRLGGRAAALGLAGLVLAVAASLLVGARILAPGDVLDSLGGMLGWSDGGAADGHIQARVQRTLIGLLVGVAVALSGAALQGLTRNPLADPGILGINAGGALAVVLGLQFGWLGGVSGYVWFALLGALLSAVVVYGVASLGPAGPGPLTMTLTGAAVTAAVTSIISGVMVTNQGALDVFRFWQVGSVAGRPPGSIVPVLPLLAVGLAIVLVSGRVLNASALGEDMERALGQRVGLARAVVACGAVALAACAVALAGPIAFVGLVVPHVVRLVTGPDHRRILAGSAIVGPTLLLLTDVLGRVVAPPSEIQVGIMTAVLGAPALILLIRRTVLR